MKESFRAENVGVGGVIRFFEAFVSEPEYVEAGFAALSSEGQKILNVPFSLPTPPNFCVSPSSKIKDLTTMTCNSKIANRRPGLTRSCCEVAFFNESPSRQTGCSLVVGCAAYAFDVSDHNVIVREYVSFQLV